MEETRKSFLQTLLQAVSKPFKEMSKNKETSKKNIDTQEQVEDIQYKESSFLSELREEVVSSIQSENETKGKKGSKGGGLKKKYEIPTIEVEDMTPEKLEEMRKKLEEGRGERE